jgi:hypothetical protein
MELIRGLTPICSRNCRPKLEGLKEAVRRVGGQIVFINYLEGTQSLVPGSRSVESRPLVETI